MKKIMLFVLAICLCFTTFGTAFAETAAAEKPAAEMTAEELYRAGVDGEILLSRSNTEEIHSAYAAYVFSQLSERDRAFPDRTQRS